VTSLYQYDGERLLVETHGSTVYSYTYGNALLRMNGEYSLYDGMGSARAVTDASQAVTRTMSYYAFGQLATTSGSSSTPYTFGATSGYRGDGDAGLTLVGARYYDSQVGRFVTRDTELDQKPYLYCEHDPINHLDPSGHKPPRPFGDLDHLPPGFHYDPGAGGVVPPGGSVIGNPPLSPGGGFSRPGVPGIPRGYPGEPPGQGGLPFPLPGGGIGWISGNPFTGSWGISGGWGDSGIWSGGFQIGDTGASGGAVYHF
jgi:RHS repeat-associated protein